MADGGNEKPYHEPTIPFSEQRSEVRARAGIISADALDHAHGTWRFSSSRARPVQLYVREDFLTYEECEILCGKIDAGAVPSPLYEKDKAPDARTSETCFFDHYDPLIVDLNQRLSDLMGIDLPFGEPLQGQKYSVTQEFKDHADFFYIDQPYWPIYEPQGGQRTWTAMAYIRSPERGGGTSFPYLNLDIEPRLGRLLIWNNMALDGSPNPWTMHAGRPVEQGVKYIFTKWYRERHFGTSA